MTRNVVPAAVEVVSHREDVVH
ncbi:hypothetical protein D031_1062, partial [Vibrio parahaemolyticus VP-48]